MTLGNELFALAVEWLYDHNKVADQKELAQVTGITETIISRILNNKVKKPSDATVRKLLNAFPGLFNPNYFRGKSLYMLMSDVIEERIDAEEKKQNALDMDELAGAPFMANRATEYSGSLFTSGGAFAITLNDEWDTPWTGSW